MSDVAHSVLIAGAGNIGSHLAPLVARAGVNLLRIVDRDVVEEKNLANQAFHRADVGRPKAEVLAARVRSMNPHVTVEPIVGDVGQLPTAVFDVDVIFGVVDSRRARQALVTDIGWPLGKPVVDGGVGEGLLGRVQVFVPGETTACLECGWTKGDYQRLSEEYPCDPGATYNAPSTVSPAFSGAVVAGLMAAEGLRLLAGTEQRESCEIAFDLNHRRFLPSRLRRAPKCRFDHITVTERLSLDKPFAKATVGDLIDLIDRRFPKSIVQVESRRGLMADSFPWPQRVINWGVLSPFAKGSLASIGLKPGDFLRLRCHAGNAFVVLGGNSVSPGGAIDS